MEFIAEIGMNYNTNKGLIPEMVRIASNSGANYAKLQLGWRDKPGEINNLSTEDIIRFSDSCNYYNIKPLFSIISPSAWEMEDIRNMPENFIKSGYSGFSDHTHGISASLIAIARGAKVIERHFTLDKSDSTIRDHAGSSTPDEFKEMVQVGREISKLYEILNSDTGKV